MSDLICRQAAIEAVMNIDPLAFLDCKTLKPIEATQKTFDIIRALKELPSVEAEPVKRGRWVEYNYPSLEHVYCSNCKEEYYVDDLLMGRNDYPSYCPNCGARMETES